MNFVKVKIVVMFFLLIGGLLIIFIGLGIFMTEPDLKHGHQYAGTFESSSGKIGEIEIIFVAFNGLLTNQNIDTEIGLRFIDDNEPKEAIILFPNARVLDLDYSIVPIQGKIIPLNLKNADPEGSYYSSKTKLQYFHSGQFNAILKISGDETYEKDLGIVIEIVSWEQWLVNKNNNNSIGLMLMVAGITVITTGPVFTKLVDHVKELQTKN